MSESPEDLIAKAAVARREHRLDDALLAYAAAAGLSRSNGRTQQLVAALCGSGQIARDQGHPELAQRHYAEALEVSRAGDDPLLVAQTARHLGDIHREHASPDQAEPLLMEAIHLYRSNLGTSILDLANALRPLALLKTEAGDVRAARALWQEARVLYSAIHVSAGVGECTEQLERLASSFDESSEV